MKDARITVWTNPQSLLTGTTTNTGPTIDLFGGNTPVGVMPDGTGIFGITVEIIQTWVSGTAQVTDWTWNVSSDGATWVTGGDIGSSSLAAAGNQKFRSNLRTRYRYAQLVASNTGVGASTAVAYPEDGGMFTGTSAIENA